MATGAGIDLASLMEQYTSQGTAESTQLDNLNRIEGQLGSSIDTEQNNIRKEALLSGQVKSAVDQIILDRAQRNKEAAAFFGVNTEVSNSIVQALSSEVIQQHTELNKSAKAIQVRQQKSFTDDPLGWIYDQFALPGDIQAHNTGVAVMEGNLDTLQKLGKLADEQIARNNAIDANTSAAMSRLEADRLLAAAEIRAQDARQKALAMGIQLGSVRLATTQQAFANMIQLHQAGIAVQHLQLTRASKDLQIELKELQKQNLQLLIDKKDEDQASREELQSNLDKATAVLGMRRISTNEYDHAPAQTKAALFEVMSSPDTREGRLGYDTVDAVQTAHRLNAPLTPSMQDVKKVITNWTSEVSSNPVYGALKPEEKHGKAMEHITAKLKAEVNNIPDSGGLYSAPGLQSVGKIPVVANTILWKSVFAPIAAASATRPTSAQGFYDAALQLVGAGNMDIDRASTEIATIYKAITIDNTQMRDYNRFALPIQNNYRTTVRTGSGPLNNDFGGAKVIDMTNPTEIKNNLLRSLNAQKLEKAGTGGFGPVP